MSKNKSQNERDLKYKTRMIICNDRSERFTFDAKANDFKNRFEEFVIKNKKEDSD